MLRMANTNKVPDINLEIHRTSRLNSGENEGKNVTPGLLKKNFFSRFVYKISQKWHQTRH